MPRPYHLGQRQITTEETRARILSAARELLAASEGFAGFTIDAIARQANVARMTIYYQFGSKVGLLEALVGALAARGGMEQLAGVFRRPDPLEALDEYISVFSRFWDSDRLAVRRLRALAALDPDFEQVVRGRDEWRRGGVRVLCERLCQARGRPAPAASDEMVTMLFTLLSFESFDTLAGPTRSIVEVTPIIRRLVHAVLEVELGGAPRG